MGGARSHEELIVWQLAYELKLGVYELIRTSPRRDLRQLRMNAPVGLQAVALNPVNLLNLLNLLNQNKIR